MGSRLLLNNVQPEPDLRKNRNGGHRFAQRQIAKINEKEALRIRCGPVMVADRTLLELWVASHLVRCLTPTSAVPRSILFAVSDKGGRPLTYRVAQMMISE